jgi:hypothetical protein
MTIAEQIKNSHVENETVKNYEAFYAELKEKTVEADKNWCNISTTYTFADGSCIIISGPDVRAYDCK